MFRIRVFGGSGLFQDLSEFGCAMVPLRGPYNKDYNSLWSIVGSPPFSSEQRIIKRPPAANVQS